MTWIHHFKNCLGIKPSSRNIDTALDTGLDSTDKLTLEFVWLGMPSKKLADLRALTQLSLRLPPLTQLGKILIEKF